MRLPYIVIIIVALILVRLAYHQSYLKGDSNDYGTSPFVAAPNNKYTERVKKYIEQKYSTLYTGQVGLLNMEYFDIPVRIHDIYIYYLMIAISHTFFLSTKTP